MAFVPVAINYDRVLEDRVLITADANGNRKFHARISVILWFILRKTWQRLRGRFMRFGEAAVVCGVPVRLSEYGNTPALEPLAEDLMHRIETAMPLTFVPLMARIMLQSEGPLDDQALHDAMMDGVQQADVEAKTLISEDTVTRTRLHMEQRRMIERTEEGWQMVTGEDALLAFYANSIEHFFEDAATAA